MTDDTHKVVEPETIVEMARVGGLSDAVFAVALTLLVLDIRIPRLPPWQICRPGCSSSCRVCSST